MCAGPKDGALVRVGPSEGDPGARLDNLVWLPSFVALGVADACSVFQSTSGVLAEIRALGAVGGAALLMTSIRDWRRAQSEYEKVDASSNMAWGLQGLLYLPASSPVLHDLGLGLGIFGAATQMTVGVLRINQGVREGQPSTIKLGALDVACGLAWLGWDLIAVSPPLFVGSYVVLKIGREAYNSRDSVSALGQSARTGTSLAYEQLRGTVGTTWRSTREALARFECNAKRMLLRPLYRAQVMAECRSEDLQGWEEDYPLSAR